MTQLLHLPFVQRGLLEVLLLSIAGGVLGTWIVLRGLSFFSHGVGTAAFPGLVLADGLGFAAPLGAVGAAALFAAGVGTLARVRRTGYDSSTGLVLVGCLAVGVVLASDVFHSGARVENLLFGSLLAISGPDLVLAAGVAVLALAGSFALGPRWLAGGFDSDGPRSSAGALTPALLALVALATVASLSAVGALLPSALLVVPAATTRPWVRGVTAWQLASIALAAAEGIGGLWLSLELDAPPGATIAVISGGAFALSTLARGMRVPAPAAALAGAGALALGLLLAGAGAGNPEGAGAAGGGRVVVAASTTQLADFARAVGGDAVSVHGILRPNSDPHEYEPRPRDVEALAGARLVLESGAGLDSWLGPLRAEAGRAPLLVLSDGLPVQRPGDPHWWHDPVNARAAVTRIAVALARADPAHRELFARNARTYERRLSTLQAGIARCFAALAPEQRKLVTDHDAFGYFAARFGLEVVGTVIPALSTQAQPSAGDVARLARIVRRERVRALFPERAVNPELTRAIARQTGARSDGRLYGDALGAAGSPGATYVGMESANADTIVRGLSGGRRGCAPEGAR